MFRAYNKKTVVETIHDEVVRLLFPMEMIKLLVIDSTDDETSEMVKAFFTTQNDSSFTPVHEEEVHDLAIAVYKYHTIARNQIAVKIDPSFQISDDTLRSAAPSITYPGIRSAPVPVEESFRVGCVEEGYVDVQSYTEGRETQVSLFRAGANLVPREGDGPWETDKSFREVCA